VGPHHRPRAPRLRLGALMDRELPDDRLGAVARDREALDGAPMLRLDPEERDGLETLGCERLTGEDGRLTDGADRLVDGLE
jgi:hypothetical protein